ncbi:MAG: molybdopterin converting factor small subunit [Parvicellaceae bacterium]|jgi:molybdopterin converting factor small subunit
MKVVYFGVIQEKIGLKEDQLNAGSLNELKDDLHAKYDFLKSMTYTIFVNQSKIDGDLTLSETDEVVICPPFSGG